MKKYIFVLLITFTSVEASTLLKESVIQNLKNIDNINFNFEQNINGKVEKGICTIEYPKKIHCKYNLSNQKILVSNGKSLAIKTLSSYYLYPLDKTPLNLILNKEFLLDKINSIDERIVDDKFINYNFFENENKINIFFDKKNYNLVGWQTVDIYQNLSITFLNTIIKNQKLEKNLFKLPNRN